MSDRYIPEIVKEGSFYNIRPKNLRFVEVENENGRRFLAYWVAWHMQDMVNNACVSIGTDIPFNNPALVNLLTGEVVKIKFNMEGGHQNLLELPLADYPFVVAEEESLKVER